MFGVRARLTDLVRERELVLEALVAERLRFAAVGRADAEHRHRLPVPLVVAAGHLSDAPTRGVEKTPKSGPLQR
jgi:hypothetical protein